MGWRFVSTTPRWWPMLAGTVMDRLGLEAIVDEAVRPPEAGRGSGAKTPSVRSLAGWQRLGLGGWFGEVGAAALEDAVFAMVADRLSAPCSKRRLTEWAAADVVMPEWWSAPSADRYYRALDAVAVAKAGTEEHLYSRLCDLANLDLRLVCYDLTSTYFEGPARPSDRFPSRAFWYSRDHRPDRPQIVIGLLCATDGIPVAHHVFAGNTNDASTLRTVLEDLARRFAVGRICVVADRGLISSDNVEAVAAAGFDRVLATRLRRDQTTSEALEAIDEHTAWVEIPQHRCRACDVTLAEGTRAIVVDCDARARRDAARAAEIVAAAEAELLALARRVREGRLKDPAKIGRAAQRILANSGTGRLFDLDIAQGRFLYHYNEKALAHEELLAGRYVLTTSLTPAQASTAQIVTAYRKLAAVAASSSSRTSLRAKCRAIQVLPHPRTPSTSTAPRLPRALSTSRPAIRGR